MFYCYQILCFSMSTYLNAYKLFLFILTVALWNIFSPQKICVLGITFLLELGDNSITIIIAI